jgi:hypothetical protein
MGRVNWIGAVRVASWALSGCFGQAATEEAELGTAKEKLCDGPGAQGGFQLSDMITAITRAAEKVR